MSSSMYHVMKGYVLMQVVVKAAIWTDRQSVVFMQAWWSKQCTP